MHTINRQTFQFLGAYFLLRCVFVLSVCDFARLRLYVEIDDMAIVFFVSFPEKNLNKKTNMVFCSDLLHNRKFEVLYAKPEFYYVGDAEKNVVCTCTIQLERGKRIKVICQSCFRQGSRRDGGEDLQEEGGSKEEW